MNNQEKATSKLSWLPAAIVVAILLALLGYMFTINNSLTDFKVNMEHRLTILEERLNGSTRQLIGDYEWETRKASDASDGHERMGIRIDVLYDHIEWSCGSSTVIVRNGAEVNLAPIIKSYSEQTRDARAIIAVGMSSMEGSDLVEEEALAKNRIRTLLDSFRDNLGGRDLPLYGYWLGQYGGGSGTCRTTGGETAVQRRVVLLKVLYWDASISQSNSELEQSIKRILVGKAVNEGNSFPFDIRQYSRFRSQRKILLADHDFDRVE